MLDIVPLIASRRDYIEKGPQIFLLAFMWLVWCSAGKQEPLNWCLDFLQRELFHILLLNWYFHRRKEHHLVLLIILIWSNQISLYLKCIRIHILKKHTQKFDRIMYALKCFLFNFNKELSVFCLYHNPDLAHCNSISIGNCSVCLYGVNPLQSSLKCHTVNVTSSNRKGNHLATLFILLKPYYN